MNKIKSFFKSECCRYFEYALLAFGGLGLEMIYAYFLEPLLYGHSMKEFTTAECVIHWTVTVITWGIAAWMIVRGAKKELGFQLNEGGKKWTLVGILASCILVGLMAFVNYLDVGDLKIIYEFHRLGTLKFIFQHLYYMMEVVLVSLIIIFGQKSMESLFRKKNVPYGGIIVGITWGFAHWLTKGSILIGLEGLVLGFLFGAIYVLLGRDFKKTYIVLVITFII